MKKDPLHEFKAKIQIIGVNPYVLLPEKVLQSIFKMAKKDKGPIPVCGKIDGNPFLQTLVKYSGKWRLYINGPMLKSADKTVGQEISVELTFDPEERIIPVHPKLKAALDRNKKAKAVFESLPPSRKKEIIRYISFLKTEKSIDKNIERMVRFLLGEDRFVGRDKP